MDVKPPLAAKRKAAPLDAARAERGVWLVKVPQFLASQWQSEAPLALERDGARSRVEPVLSSALVPVIKCVHLAAWLTRRASARAAYAPPPGTAQGAARARPADFRVGECNQGASFRRAAHVRRAGLPVNREPSRSTDGSCDGGFRELEASRAIAAGVLKPAAAPGAARCALRAAVCPPTGADTERRDAFAHLLPALHALVDAETRLVLSGGGRTCKQRLKEAARATLVPTGSGFAQATLGGAIAALLAQPAEARAASLEDDAVLARLVADASCAVAAARVPQAQISSGTIGAHLEAAEPLLGRVRMAFDPCAVPAAPAEFTLTLGGFGSEGVPRDYGLRRATEVPAMHVFGEPAVTAGAAPGSGGNYAPLAGLPPGGVASAEGVVERKFDVHLLDADDAEYRRLNRARMTAASTKTRVAKQVAEFATMVEPADGAPGPSRGRAMLEQAPLRVALPARHNVLSKHAQRGGAPQAQHEPMAADALQARLFELFETRSHWKIADLERATHQRLALLKQVLSGIAEMDRAPGPNRGAFQLLPHLRRAS